LGLRPGGGYVLEIRVVDAGGKIDAVHVNSKPDYFPKPETWYRKKLGLTKVSGYTA